MILNYLQAGAGALAGAVLTFTVLSVYNVTIDNPSVRRETRAAVEAQVAKRTEAAINEVQNNADRNRAMRRHCVDSGRVYDFGANRCGRLVAVPHG